VEKGLTDIDGPIPVNPSGGVLSTNCIGASAMLRIWEAACRLGAMPRNTSAQRGQKAFTTAYGGTNWTVMTALSKTLDD